MVLDSRNKPKRNRKSRRATEIFKVNEGGVQLCAHPAVRGLNNALQRKMQTLIQTR